MAPAQEILARNTFLISIFFFALCPRTKKIRYLGVTPPISEAGPTPVEVAVTNALIEALKERGMFESEEESQRRCGRNQLTLLGGVARLLQEANRPVLRVELGPCARLRREIVLGKLDKMVKDFVYKVSIKKLPEPIAREAGGKIFTFGSYRLGVHASGDLAGHLTSFEYVQNGRASSNFGAGADIDTLCVVPRHVKREDFFTVLFESLKARPEVTDLTAVPDAYVPVMKMSFSDIPIDLVFAQLQLISVADDLSLADDNLLRDLDERCIRSLNGSRMTDEILRLVPNTLAFRISLRCIKLWAKRRAIYSNVMGFLGGVAWAMLVARVCQLYPNAAAGNIVSKFFRIMFQWNWPQPVMLKSIDEGPLQVRVWNPKVRYEYWSRAA
ncbi:MAG: Poly(A) polymerase central domain-containing protein, partial [Olpidium bornovanus]